MNESAPSRNEFMMDSSATDEGWYEEEKVLPFSLPPSRSRACTAAGFAEPPLPLSLF